MKIDTQKLTKIIKRQGLTLSTALARSHVSRTAYYSLTRKRTLLPQSIQLLAKTLGVRPTTFLVEEDHAERVIHKLYQKVASVLSKHPEADRENVLHTLLLLQEKPIERLRRSLIRGRHNIYRKGD